MVGLVDGNSGVDDLWGDGLLVDDWLDSLVDMVVDMLTLDDWSSGGGVPGLVGGGGAGELSSLAL